MATGFTTEVGVDFPLSAVSRREVALSRLSTLLVTESSAEVSLSTLMFFPSLLKNPFLAGVSFAATWAGEVVAGVILFEIEVGTDLSAVGGKAGAGVLVTGTTEFVAVGMLAGDGKFALRARLDEVVDFNTGIGVVLAGTTGLRATGAG